jgi:hypothetical protein
MYPLICQTNFTCWVIHFTSSENIFCNDRTWAYGSFRKSNLAGSIWTNNNLDEHCVRSNVRVFPDTTILVCVSFANIKNGALRIKHLFGNKDNQKLSLINAI